MERALKNLYATQSYQVTITGTKWNKYIRVWFYLQRLLPPRMMWPHRTVSGPWF